MLPIYYLHQPSGLWFPGHALQHLGNNLFAVRKADGAVIVVHSLNIWSPGQYEVIAA